MCLFSCRCKMIMKVILFCIIHIRLFDVVNAKPYDVLKDRANAVCLTGYMTDIQTWVTLDGQLTVARNDAVVDLSSSKDVMPALQEHLQSRSRRTTAIRYLSMAKCGLREVPTVAFLSGGLSANLAKTMEYVTFYGNNFGQFQVTSEKYDSILNATSAKEVLLDPHKIQKKSTWSAGLQNVIFPNLKELDLRACDIEVLDAFIFQGMPSLTSLYLGENFISVIAAHAFVGLTSLRHLDLSRNVHVDDYDPKRSLFFESADTFQRLNLVSLDLSYTTLGTRNVLGSLGTKLERLSLCHTGIYRLRAGAFANTSLKYLDLSGNSDVLFEEGVLRGLEKSLRVLYVNAAMLKSLGFIKNFSVLEVLRASHNEISTLSQDALSTLKNLQILDLESNRISAWFTNIISTMPRLKLLTLMYNNINVITEQVITDIANVKYVAMSKNLMVCYCYVRDMYEIAFKNEFRFKDTNITSSRKENSALMFHTGFSDYNAIIKKRKNVSASCFELNNSNDISNCFAGDYSTNLTGNFLYLDYNEGSHNCFSMKQGESISYTEVVPCGPDLRDLKPEAILKQSRNNLLLLCIPLIVLPVLVFIYAFRRNFRYFLITIRNSAMLSLINEKNVVDETKIFNYDVFVSYCNEDRTWVLDHLLPHVEKDCSISVCLHERDFQVGLSILENIVSCMDRSRSIMLIISRRFLLSQWCQFEMHLAQHRLLETRREDLILILLEEIPRSLRPNTLHYLMLTKTYIVWPKEDIERKEFWKRLKKSLVMQKLKNTENDSLA